MKILVAGHDPGAVNYAEAVISFQRDYGPLKLHVERLMILPVTVSDLTVAHTQECISGFINHVQWLQSHNLDIYAFERFVSRGVKGTLVEKVNYMLGMCVAARKLKNREQATLGVMASTWKTAANKFFSLKDFYKCCAVTPHEVDAALIAVYAAHKHFKLKPFSMFDSDEVLQDFSAQCEMATSGKLRKIRSPRKPEVH